MFVSKSKSENVVAQGKTINFPRAFLLVFFLFASINSHSNTFDQVLFVLSKDTTDFRKIVNLITTKGDDSKNYHFMVFIDDESAEIEKNLKTSDIIVTLGTSAANKILAKKIAQPVINTLITESVFNSLAEKYYGDSSKAIASGVNPILLDQPFERRLNLAYGLVKKLDNVGVMLGPSATGSVNIYNEAIKQKRLIPQMVIIDPDKNPIKQLDPVIRSSDVFIPLADSHLINVTTAKWILQLAYRYRVPVIGFSSNYVAAGALASVYSSPQNVSQQTAELIESLLTKTHKNQLHFPKYCTIKFNKTVAWHLNLEIPKAFQKNTGRCDL